MQFINIPTALLLLTSVLSVTAAPVALDGLQASSQYEKCKKELTPENINKDIARHNGQTLSPEETQADIKKHAAEYGLDKPKGGH
ncbi:hypothetical protein HYALB_00003461 [Hymenoscyphus albidus]|uniref:Uncharacterized protein n=1 Tax=Hymenoscyphus albidus TaxID=595503 RepID=A0A9N9LQP7_9HELO|nr:hypothetical protein HYALB_00003461 [Hymenoscyphus albidus]